MLKVLLSAACAAALCAGVAQAQTNVPTYKHGQSAVQKPNLDAKKMPDEATRRALSERGQRTGEQGGVASQDNPNGTNSLPPARASRSTTGGSNDRMGSRTDASGNDAYGRDCHGMASEIETTRCLNRQSLASVEGGSSAGGSMRGDSDSMRGGSAGESRRDPLTTQGRNRDK